MDRMVRVAVLAVVALGLARAANAHPAPFSYLDLRVSASRIDVTLVAHIFDLAHELNVAPNDLLDPVVARSRAADITAILGRRMSLLIGGRAASSTSWSAPEIIADRQAWKLSFHYDVAAPP